MCPSLQETKPAVIDWHTPDTCPRLNDFSDRLSTLEGSIDNILSIIHKGTESSARLECKLHENNTATAEMLDIISSGKGFFKTMKVLGSVLKWGLGIATAIAAFILTLKTGKTL